MERLFTDSEHKKSVRFNFIFGFVLGGLLILCFIKIFGGTFGIKPANAEEVRIAAERKAHEAAMLSRLNTAQLPATGITENNELFWIVDRYEHSPSSTEVLIEWSDNAHREHRDTSTLSDQVQMVAGRGESIVVEFILYEWWKRRTMQVDPNMPIVPPPS